MTKALRRFIADQRGATAVEYGLIAALVSLAAGAMISALGGTTNDMWTFVRDSVVAAIDGALG